MTNFKKYVRSRILILVTFLTDPNTVTGDFNERQTISGVGIWQNFSGVHKAPQHRS